MKATSYVLRVLAGLVTLVAVVEARAQETATTAAAPSTKPARNFARWEKEIAAMEAKDKESPPPKGGIVFIGSSTIRGWKTLQEDFPGQPVINRGFGGSEIVDSTFYADRLIFPHAPTQVFLRAGGNDIHAGKSADAVFEDF